ncbi:hypothetical protein AB1Y20_001354 [Prymnesium parvum]|uniref:PAS domain-containing protein n=1 Tax=Prymnesium parvum TaxID=97485 RepID=A0AB34K828_PRYPA
MEQRLSPRLVRPFGRSSPRSSSPSPRPGSPRRQPDQPVPLPPPALPPRPLSKPPKAPNAAPPTRPAASPARARSPPPPPPSAAKAAAPVLPPADPPSGGDELAALQRGILSTLRAAALQDAPSALRELQRIHSHLSGPVGAKVLSSLEALWQRHLNPALSVSQLDGASQETEAHDPPASGSPACTRPAGRGKALVAKPDGEAGKAPSQRELAHLTMQKIQSRCRELQADSRALEAEIRRKKAEVQEVNEQVAKARRRAGRGREAGEPLPHGGSAALARAQDGIAKLEVAAAAADGDEAGGAAQLQEELACARADLELTINDLRAILEATPIFVCAVDPQGCVSGWNTAAIELTGLRRDLVLQKHFVENFVPAPHQKAMADVLEAAYSLPATDPLANEPSDPFELVVWRGGAAKRQPNVVKLTVRAFTRRLADGAPVGLLLLQQDALSNEALRARTAADQDVLRLQETVSLRDEELEAQKETIKEQRAELQQLYLRFGVKPPVQEARVGGGTLASRGESKRRVSFGDINRVATFTRGSSPAEFGDKVRHEEMKSRAFPPSDSQSKQPKMKH